MAHGGGKRCQTEGCTKSAIADTCRCKAHGGGRRYQQEGCTKAATSGGTPYCMAHGGGKRCREEDCFELASGSWQQVLQAMPTVSIAQQCTQEEGARPTPPYPPA